jgi:hypothetical protein
MDNPAVQSGDVDTGWLEREWTPALAERMLDAEAHTAAIAAALLVDSQREVLPEVTPVERAEGAISAWRLVARRAAAS